jgi:hypothetical protein
LLRRDGAPTTFAKSFRNRLARSSESVRFASHCTRKTSAEAKRRMKVEGIAVDRQIAVAKAKHQTLTEAPEVLAERWKREALRDDAEMRATPPAVESHQRLSVEWEMVR